MPTTATPAQTVMDLLRDSTADLHKAAETHPMQKSLVQGVLPVERYADYLEQLWIVHRALDKALAAAVERDERLTGLDMAASMHVRHLELDLGALGRDLGSVEPTRSAWDLAQTIERDGATTPVLLAGHFYVLEGSMNGNAFIARAVGRVYELKPNAGLAYLHSYGETQRPKWASFKERMNALEFDPAEREGLVERAQGVFRAIKGIADELDSRV
ncbi:MAG: hypothetical protein Tsb0013_19070 [Phycisphaerales bacterium]